MIKYYFSKKSHTDERFNLNIFNILIISGVIHGFIFSTIVLSDKKTKNNFFLALTVLFLSISNLQYWLLDTNLANTYSIFKYTFIPWHWLILPMFFLYVEKYTGQNSIPSYKKTLLIVPFLIVL